MAQDDATAMQWLNEHPDDPAAPGVRAKLRSKGFQVNDPPPPPSLVGDVGRTLEQSWLLDPLEAVGGMAENIPGIGPYARAAGAALPQSLQEHLANTKAAAERHPILATGASILNPLYLAAPELGVGRLLPEAGALTRGAIAGGVSSLLEPTDPDAPGFWTRKGVQAGIGTATGGALGRVTGRADEAAAKAAADQAAHTKNVNTAIGENLRREGATNLANQAAKDAHAQSILQHAAEEHQAAAAAAQALVNRSQAMSSHLEDVAARVADAHAKAQEFNAARTAHLTEVQRIHNEHADALAQHAAQVADRGALDARKNVEWYQRTLAPLGLESKAPTEASGASLAKVQTMIGNELNRANRQFTLTNTPVLNDTLMSHFATASGEIVNRDVRDRFQKTFARQVLAPLAKGKLSGEDFAGLVTKLNREADGYARGANRTNPNAADNLAAADALHAIVNEIEGASEGPYLARQLRQKAREAYNRFSILSGAAEPQKGGVASSQEIISHWTDRLGPGGSGHQRWNATVETDPDKQFLEGWRKESVAPKPQPPDKPVFPPAPKPPDIEPLPKAKKKATKEIPEPKATAPPTAPKEIPQPTKIPIPEKPAPKEAKREPGWLSRTAKTAAHIGIGAGVGHATGLGPWKGYLLTAPTLETLAKGAKSKAARAVGRGVARRPGPAGGGAAAGKGADVTFKILGIEP